ncbi:MAG: DHH family phosphoesterase [Candidatus Dormibacterales bacterium]
MLTQRDGLISQIEGLIGAHDEVLIFGHKDADGDTLGCSLAFAEALKNLGKKAWVVIPPPLPTMYEWLPGYESVVGRPPPGADPHLVFFFDAGNMERSGDAVEHIAHHATIVNVDHHLSNTRFGHVNLIEPDASAVGQIVIRMLECYGFPITPGMATNLYTALMTDTGGFRHENTTADCLSDAAKLARLGANPAHIATMVYKSRPLTTLRLNALSLASMEIGLEGALIWARVTRRMLMEAGAAMPESEGIIDTLNSIADMEMAILFKEVGPKLTKISVRSRGAVDASALTATFGGGGHLRAAGAELRMPMEEAVRTVVAASTEAIHDARGPQPR